jgi:predicted metalloprotease with PDZ domain
MRPIVILAVATSLASARAQSPLATYSDAFIQRHARTVPKVDYTVTVRERDRSAYWVEMTVANAPDPLRVAIPAWAPGSYRLTHGARNIGDVTAVTAAGEALAVTRADELTWSVATGGARRIVVRYSTAVRRAEEWARPNNRWFLRETSGLIDGPRTFLYVVGSTLAPSHVTFRLPAGWEIGTGLVPTGDSLVYWAPSYDVLIDSPALVGRFATFRFTAGGVPHRAVVDLNGGRAAFDTLAFVDMLRRISQTAIDIFGGAPYADYTYIYAGAGGGLEHLNSTTIGIDLERMAEDPRAHQGVTAHEFFHTWNVKRIRPVELGPFDYTRPVRTLNLWISEGVTDYYTRLILVRSGLDPVARFLEGVAGAITSHQRNPARLTISPERSSWTTWDGPEANGGESISYYLQGDVLGLLLDLAIRDSTDNRASLDDLMRYLLDHYAGERGFTNEEVLNAVNAVSGADFHDFWRRYVSGTADIPWNAFLQAAGWRVDFEAVRLPDRRLALLGPTGPGGHPRVVVTPGSAAAQAGLRTGDELVSFNDQPVGSARDLTAATSSLEPGDRVRVRILRGGNERELAWSVPAYTEREARIVDLPSVTARARRIRAGLLGQSSPPR